MSIPDTSVDLLGKLLDVASLRHRVVAHNVANVNTPGYRQLDVSFEETFVRRLASGDVAGALQVQEEVTVREGGAERPDGNNVDIDLEMGRLHKNTLLYRTYIQLLGARLGLLRSAITGR